MLGIVVEHVSNSPSDYVMFRELNKIAEKTQCFLFTNSIQSVPMKNKFSILQHIQAMSHRGTLIATSLITSQIALKSLTASKVVYYPWDLEWLKLSEFGASQITNILNNKDLNIVARSDNHYETFSKLFKKPSGVVYNWKADDLLKVV